MPLYDEDSRFKDYWDGVRARDAAKNGHAVEEEDSTVTPEYLESWPSQNGRYKPSEPIPEWLDQVISSLQQEVVRQRSLNEARDKSLRKLAERLGRHGADILQKLDKDGVAAEEDPDAGPLPFIGLKELLARPRTPLDFLVQDILVAQEATLISGMERSFKSFFALEMAVCCVAGLRFLERVPTASARVALIDLENRQARLAERIEASLRHKGLNEDDIDRITEQFQIFDRTSFETKGHFALNKRTMARLCQNLDAFKPTLVILDNMTKALPPGTDEKLSEQMQPLIDGLVRMADERNIALVIADHDTKAGTMASGSGVKLRLIGNVIHLVHDRRSRVSAVTCSSLRNAEPFKTFGITVDHSGVLVPVALDDTEDAPPDPRQLVISALRDGAKTVLHLTIITGLSDKQIRPVLKGECARRNVGIVGTAPSSGGRGADLYGLLDPAAAEQSRPPLDERIAQMAFAPEGADTLDEEDSVP